MKKKKNWWNVLQIGLRSALIYVALMLAYSPIIASDALLLQSLNYIVII